LTLLVRAKTIVPCDTEAAQNGVSFAALGQIDNGAILCEAGRIIAMGKTEDIEKLATADNIETIDLQDCIIMPGFVDAHAHPLFAGDREPDFASRLRGEKPQLGMLHTVEQTRTALLEPARFWQDIIAPRLQLMLAHGTTTLETKTGYALHAPGEHALLDLIVQHNDDAQLPQMIPTFLGAHALAPEFQLEGYDRFIDYLIDQAIPTAKAHGAIYADAFCESGFFTPQQTRRYLIAARDAGLRLRVHCDEMAFGQAAEMAIELGVDAVDHCNYIREEDVRGIVERGIVTVACPATISYLDLPRKAPVRALLDGGGTVALASDYNPGTSPCFNLQTVAYFGRKLFGLTAPEAVYAVTRAAARSLRLEDAGRLKVGGPADFVALQIDSPDEFGWQFGGNLAKHVVRNGNV
jgi:imidazolonepropionase